MQSIINSRITISPNNWAISLVKRGTHTMIVLESIGLDNKIATDNQLEPEMRTFDFLPKDPKALHSWRSSIKAVVKNSTFIGEVREILYLQPYNTFSDELSPEARNKARKNLFYKKSWSANKVETWVCPAENARKMVASIREDIQRSDRDEMQLDYRGKTGLNCTNWVETKLGVAGIQPSHHHPVRSKVAVYPGTLIACHHHLHFKPHSKAVNHKQPEQTLNKPEKIEFRK